MKGFLLIDKEKGETSFDVIRKLRKLSDFKKMGHAGTLDPLATGLLLVAIGEGTKLLEFFIGLDKEYEVKGKFGFISDSFDGDGKIGEVNNNNISREDIENIIKDKFLGGIMQIPPKFSAVRIDGMRAYKKARSGEDFEMKEREVKINSFDIIEYNWPFVKFRVGCGSGTYIRSLIHDLGRELGCGAYVEELRRTKIGNFSVSNTIKIDDFLNKKFEQELVSLESICSIFPHLSLNDEDYFGLKDGRVIMNKKIEHPFVMALYNGRLVGVLEMYGSGGLKYKKMIL